MGKCESYSRTQCSHDYIGNSVCASDPTSGHWGNYSFCNRVIIGGVCVEAGAHQIAARCGQNDVRTNTTQTTNKTQTHHLCVEFLVNSARAYPTDIIDIVPDVLALTCRYLCTLLRACRTESRTEIEERQAFVQQMRAAGNTEHEATMQQQIGERMEELRLVEKHMHGSNSRAS